MAELAEPVDIVVTSSAGYPLDQNFYQSIKGLTGVLRVLKPGGTIILAADLREGIGSPEFASLFTENGSLDQFMQRITGGDATQPDYFVMDQWQLEELAKVARQAHIVYVTEACLPKR